MKLVPLPTYQTIALRFMRCGKDLQIYLANLCADPGFPASYTAPEQYHIWTIPSGKLVVQDLWDLKA